MRARGWLLPARSGTQTQVYFQVCSLSLMVVLFYKSRCLKEIRSVLFCFGASSMGQLVFTVPVVWANVRSPSLLLKYQHPQHWLCLSHFPFFQSHNCTVRSKYSCCGHFYATVCFVNAHLITNPFTHPDLSPHRMRGSVTVWQYSSAWQHRGQLERSCCSSKHPNIQGFFELGFGSLGPVTLAKLAENQKERKRKKTLKDILLPALHMMWREIDFLDGVLFADPAGSWSKWAWKADDKYAHIRYLSAETEVILETDIHRDHSIWNFSLWH